MENKLIVHLKQHTPIIHFQHAQPGATLRATEVKAKLDRFIFTKFQGIFPDEKELCQKLEYFDPEDKGASIYKLNINAYGSPKKILIVASLNPEQKDALKRAEPKISYIEGSSFFALEEEVKHLFEKTGNKVTRPPKNDKKYDELRIVANYDEKISKWGLIYEEPIELSIMSFDPAVKVIIKKIAPYFFAYENFGTRQSKGFGSFSVIGSPVPYPDLINQVFPYKYQYDHIFRGDLLSKLQQQFERIQSDYKLLKSGRGARERGGYRKSLVFLYGLELNPQIRWEKRQIKIEINQNQQDGVMLKTEPGFSAIYDEAGNNAWRDPRPDYVYKYLRAMLGLAEQYEFQTSRGGNVKYKVSVKSPIGIERYRSPITFKVYEGNIFLVAEDVNTFLFNKEFQLTQKLALDNPNRRDPERNMASIFTPEDLSFSMEEFLEFALETSDEHIEGYTKIEQP